MPARELARSGLYGIEDNCRRPQGEIEMRITLLAVHRCPSRLRLLTRHDRPSWPPIAPDQVKIYFHPPAQYDEIALLDTSSRGAFAITAQGKTDKVIERLKDEAAKLGANGILLQGVSDQSAGSVSTGYAQATATGHSAYASGIGFSGNVMIKAGSGVAIYVAQN